MKATLFATLGLSAVMSILQPYAFGLKSSFKSGKLMSPQFQPSIDCSERPDFLTEQRTEIVGSIDKLPQMGVLIARDAEYYVEGQTETGTPIRVHGYQSFLKSNNKTKILCGHSAKGVQERYSVFAPTLIDTTAAGKTGNSIWQFQIMANNDKFSAWNLKSPSINETEKLDKVLTKFGSKYRIYQIGHNEYELMLIQEKDGITQYLSIRYDSVISVK